MRTYDPVILFLHLGDTTYRPEDFANMSPLLDSPAGQQKARPVMALRTPRARRESPGRNASAWKLPLPRH